MTAHTELVPSTPAASTVSEDRAYHPWYLPRSKTKEGFTVAWNGVGPCTEAFYPTAAVLDDEPRPDDIASRL